MDVQVKKREGGRISLDDAALALLRSHVRGQVVLPGEAAYDTARAIWNGMTNRRPGLIVRCTGTADVVEAVKFARERDLLLCVRAGGHNIAGLAVADDALMIDLTLMRGVSVDPAAKRAIAQSGCLLGTIDRETQVHGLAAVFGFVSLTGAAGLTLGGGFGYLTRRFGWASDNLVSAEVVTAEGRVVRASERENADLFWGLRGGSGNFGVVTSLEYQLHPVGPRIMGGIILHPMSEAAKVLQFFREYTATAPRELTSVLICRIAPDAPWVPRDWQGKPVVALVLCHSGSLEQARRDLAPIKAWGKPVADSVMEKTYCEQQMTRCDAAQRASLLLEVGVARQPSGRAPRDVPRARPPIALAVLAHTALPSQRYDWRATGRCDRRGEPRRRVQSYDSGRVGLGSARAENRVGT